MDGPGAQGGTACPVPGIKSIVAGHLEVPFWDMLDEELYEINGRDGLLDKTLSLCLL